LKIFSFDFLTGVRSARAFSTKMSLAAAAKTLFQKNLTDLIKGIRANKKTEASYIARCMTEIKEEAKSKEVDIKAIAVQKLTFVCPQRVCISCPNPCFCSYK